MSRAPRECRWRADGLDIAGLVWGEAGQRPLLALHGWLDNAASFAMLAPLLLEHQVVALDLTGHGHSDHRSADATYQIWDDLPQILSVADQLGWQEFDLLGHSRGAVISGLLAAAEPDRVRRLVLLDAISPQPVAEDQAPQQLRQFLRDKRKLQGRSPRVFSDVAAAVALREDRGLEPRAAQLIVERNLRPCEGGYTWRIDPRLHGASAVKFTAGHTVAMRAALTMPVLFLLAGEGVLAEVSGAVSEMFADIPHGTLESVTGGHHFHMEKSVDTVADRLRIFLVD